MLAVHQDTQPIEQERIVSVGPQASHKIWPTERVQPAIGGGQIKPGLSVDYFVFLQAESASRDAAKRDYVVDERDAVGHAGLSEKRGPSIYPVVPWIHCTNIPPFVRQASGLVWYRPHSLAVTSRS
jgi:hypothetical protein